MDAGRLAVTEPVGQAGALFPVKPDRLPRQPDLPDRRPRQRRRQPTETPLPPSGEAPARGHIDDYA